MESVVDGIIAGLGLAVGMMMALIAPLFGEASIGGLRDESHHNPRAIHQHKGRMAA